jgi:hypothetical protein
MTPSPLYLTGRRHCSKCGRWRPISDFMPRTWEDDPQCTIIRTVTSWCRVCMARSKPRKAPRNYYPHGAPGSKAHKEHKLKRSRANREQRMASKQYRAEVNEYHRIWREAKAAETTTPRFTHTLACIMGEIDSQCPCEATNLEDVA